MPECALLLPVTSYSVICIIPYNLLSLSKLSNSKFPSQRSFVTNSHQETKTSFHGKSNTGNWTFPFSAFISGCPFLSIPLWLNHYQSFSDRMVTYPPHVTPLLISCALWKQPLLFFTDFARGLHHEIFRLCGHHCTAELSRQVLPQGRKERKEEWREGKEGGRPRREEVKEGNYCEQIRWLIYAVTIDVGLVWWHNRRWECCVSLLIKMQRLKQFLY